MNSYFKASETQRGGERVVKEVEVRVIKKFHFYSLITRFIVEQHT